ncbi:bifunctional adenosylcobinamide kinase/adenosylcobinamide-phosphate guanylyltransferase [Domibacillus sp. A3M-37]|uniref:bifunctional adenosylcobinamide kinase/adenosylcobinamide-phosphate guanylyltransferase n=1 Tax=Domibacillus sp. A3M-37 TaxID=2962037 RepID=UPI0020B8115B|nr:bifunctional adenosylcobinamide kinase/adenosylcobinamide-phosphate guanylyltransferase [Domibacillus sp. A3M-37]MCP3762209.1 bifunctional adenosylcobinamide kinase/adenosylcobinamide-phosphate guanylyltransferase [Domibacillus sp. A3M-37]
MMIFISGGVRSGKSSVAEKLAIRYRHSNGRLVYVACGSRTDREMDERIGHHQQRRTASGCSWTTIEKSIDVAAIGVEASDTLLIDCVTTLLAGEYFREDKAAFDADERITKDILTLAKQAHAVIVVSNELSFDMPASELTANYMKKLGLIHQRLVQESDAAVLVEHGLPIVKKGVISCGEL